jgi:hypothetical protein
MSASQQTHRIAVSHSDCGRIEGLPKGRTRSMSFCRLWWQNTSRAVVVTTSQGTGTYCIDMSWKEFVKPHGHTYRYELKQGHNLPGSTLIRKLRCQEH